MNQAAERLRYFRVCAPGRGHCIPATVPNQLDRTANKAEERPQALPRRRGQGRRRRTCVAPWYGRAVAGRMPVRVPSFRVQSACPCTLLCFLPGRPLAGAPGYRRTPSVGGRSAGCDACERNNSPHTCSMCPDPSENGPFTDEDTTPFVMFPPGHRSAVYELGPRGGA